MKNKIDPNIKKVENFLRKNLGIEYAPGYFVELIKFDLNETKKIRSRERNIVALSYEIQLNEISERLLKLCQKLLNK